MFGHLLSFIAAGCSEKLIKNPIALPDDNFEVFVTLAIGPDQYDTAGRHWEPLDGQRLVWATVSVKNRQPTDKKFYFRKIALMADKKEILPFIVDMDSAVTMHADPAPVLAPDETISRRLIFIVRDISELEKMVYGKKEIIIPQKASK